MSRTTLNFLLDVVLFAVLVLVLFATAIVDIGFPVLPEALRWQIWGLGYVRWSRLRFGLLCLFTVLALLHVMLHWSWVCGVINHRIAQWLGRKITWSDSQQTLVGVGLLVALLHVVGIMYLSAILMAREQANAL